ncbi:MAG: AsmA family protein [Candidatus Omnitrophica bacterium]|nr:AsmA family protein [Candidatus Omnitrophota bacterium]
MIKFLNVRKIIIVVIILAVIHFGVGLFISPRLTSLIVDKINQYTKAKVTLETFNLWPLTLSGSFKNLKVFDPDNESSRIVFIKDASARISLFGLLSRRLAISSLHIKGLEVNLQGESDGTFNIQKLAKAKEAQKEKAPGSIIDAAIKNKDWFTRVYSILKKKASASKQQKEEVKQPETKPADSEVKELPKGRRVDFKAASGKYLLEINDIKINDANINIQTEDGNSLEIVGARLELDRVGIDPENGARLGRFGIAGDIKSKGATAGSLDALYVKRNAKDSEFDVKLKEVDLNVLRFIYQDSLPVQINRGKLSLESETKLIGDTIDSKNSLILSNHELLVKEGQEESKGFMPTSMICGMLNQINPVKLDFDIGGTLEKPEFKNFQKSLMNLVMSNTKGIQIQLQDKAFEAIGDYFKKRKKKKEEGAPAPAITSESQGAQAPAITSESQESAPASATVSEPQVEPQGAIQQEVLPSADEPSKGGINE